jgi:hypothetical protein
LSLLLSQSRLLTTVSIVMCIHTSASDDALFFSALAGSCGGGEVVPGFGVSRLGRRAVQVGAVLHAWNRIGTGEGAPPLPSCTHLLFGQRPNFLVKCGLMFSLLSLLSLFPSSHWMSFMYSALSVSSAILPR